MERATPMGSSEKAPNGISQEPNTAPNRPNSEVVYSVVIAGYNRAASLARALNSVRSLNSAGLEVIYVDGGSTDGSLDVARECPNTVVIDGDKSGVAQNRNRGAGFAKGEYLVFLDDDAELPSDFIEVVARTFSDPGVGVAAPIIVDSGASARPQFDGARTLGPWFIPAPMRSSRPRRQLMAFSLQARGAAMIVRRELFRQLGGFDPSLLPYGGEDFDFCWRVWMAGKSVVLVNSRIRHEAIGSRDWNKESKRRYDRNLAFNLANYITIYLKNSSPLTLVQLPIIMPILIAFPLRQLRFRALFEGLALTCSKIRRPTPILKERKRLKGVRVRTDLAISRILSS